MLSSRVEQPVVIPGPQRMISKQAKIKFFLRNIYIFFTSIGKAVLKYT